MHVRTFFDDHLCATTSEGICRLCKLDEMLRRGAIDLSYDAAQEQRQVTDSYELVLTVAYDARAGCIRVIGDQELAK